jgi:hypothetical protein
MRLKSANLALFYWLIVAGRSYGLAQESNGFEPPVLYSQKRTTASAEIQWMSVPLSKDADRKAAKALLYFGFDKTGDIPLTMVFQFGQCCTPQCVELHSQGSDIEKELFNNLWSKLKFKKKFLPVVHFSTTFPNPHFLNQLEFIGKEVESNHGQRFIKLLFDDSNGDFRFGAVLFSDQSPWKPEVLAVSSLNAVNGTPDVLEVAFDQQVFKLPLGMIVGDLKLVAIGKRGFVHVQPEKYHVLTKGTTVKSESPIQFDLETFPFTEIQYDTERKRLDIICLSVCSRDYWRKWNQMPLPIDRRLTIDPTEPIPIDPTLLLNFLMQDGS